MSLLSLVVKARKNRRRAAAGVAVVGPRIGTDLRQEADVQHLVVHHGAWRISAA
jgi:hypothetical protein